MRFCSKHSLREISLSNMWFTMFNDWNIRQNYRRFSAHCCNSKRVKLNKRAA